MTNGSSKGDRLDRIENALDRLIGGLEETKAIVNSNSRAIEATSAAVQATSDNLDKLSTEWQETKAIVNSNSRAIQAMMEQQATDRLKHEEVMAEMRQGMTEMRDIMKRVVETQSGLTRILINHDEDRPTILRRLMTIENKVDRILEREQE